MSNIYTQSYILFSKAIMQSNKDLIQAWAKDTSNKELSESCKMVLDAAESGINAK